MNPGRYLILALLLMIQFVSAGRCFSQNDFRKVLSEGEISRLDRRGYVRVVKLLDSGRILMISERDGENPKILVVSQRGGVFKRIRLPVSSPEYIAFSDDGKWAMVSGDKGFSLYQVDLSSGRYRSIFLKEDGKKGFALYSAGESWLFFSGSRLFARGYYYDRDDSFLGETLVEIFPDKTGIAVFKPLMDMNRIKQGLKGLVPGYERISTYNVVGDYLILSVEKEGTGVLFAVNLKDELIYRIEDYNFLTGINFAPELGLMAYSVNSTRALALPGKLVLFDIGNLRKLEEWEGRYFTPRLNSSCSSMAVGESIPTVKNRQIMWLKIIDISGSESSVDLLPSFRPFDWRFVRGDRELFLFTGKEIYRYQLYSR